MIKKSLYGYQSEDINLILEKINSAVDGYHLLYQLPTGGGKTVIFSEIVRRYLINHNKKVLVLTHRVELCHQTSGMLQSFNVKNKIINSFVKNLPETEKYDCYVAMVETLNNRIKDEKIQFENLGLVIVDEAHFNSFRKLFKSFGNAVILGVTATPLSSNIKLPMNQNYHELITGSSISKLVEEGYLAKATTYSYDVGLTSLKVGINGDYTIKSSDDLYSGLLMQEKLMHAFYEYAKGKKTLIFNNGIRTSIHVLETFLEAGLPIKHLDNTSSSEERKEILHWFKITPNAILTSVGILTTGFDEPTVEVIILNRATKSLTLYLQMIGRGSRIIPGKDSFTVIDLGNNLARFGLWTDFFDWQHIFKYPESYLLQLRSDLEIEQSFNYTMPHEIREKFNKSKNIEMDIETSCQHVLKNYKKLKTVLEESLDQHINMCFENADTVVKAKMLSKLLSGDIESRISKYVMFMTNTTKNYREWLIEDYMKKLNSGIYKKFSETS
ncbi:MAG: DEAD/DEAH box helicase [Flavobacterium sp.]